MRRRVHWIAAWGALAFAHLLASLGGWLLLLSAAYLVAVVLTGILVMPRLLELLSVGDYADVERHGKDSMLASTANSLWAALLFVVGAALTLPLWLIPGAGLFLLPYSGWLGSTGELSPTTRCPCTRRRPNGGNCGVATPVRCSVSESSWRCCRMCRWSVCWRRRWRRWPYIHFCLEALRRLRSAPTAIEFNRENT